MKKKELQQNEISKMVHESNTKFYEVIKSKNFSFKEKQLFIYNELLNLYSTIEHKQIFREFS